MSTKFGVFVPQGWRMDLAQIDDPVEQYEAMTRAAQTADATAFDSIWLYDHLHTVPTPEMETTFEVWTATATLARDTKRINIGQMVGCNGYRNPALYAKIASTVDVASHGRLYAGIGAGWYEHEWKAYGFPWWETKERMAHFREAVEIIHKMWTEDYPKFSGEHYSIDGPINEPKSAGPGRKIPLWIGGGGEQVTLKLVARYGDANNVGGGFENVKRKETILLQHCETVGRDPAEIERTTSVGAMFIRDSHAEAVKAQKAAFERNGRADLWENQPLGTPETVAEMIAPFLDLGYHHIISGFPSPYDEETLTRFATEVRPLLEKG